MMIKLINIDNHKLFSDGLRAIISQEKDMLFLEAYSDGKDMKDRLKLHEPDMVLLDMYLNEKSGIAIAKEIKKIRPKTKIIILSLEVNPVFTAELEEIGVEGYISKELDSVDLLAVIRKVYAGQTQYSHDILQNSNSVTVMVNDFGLTYRELEIYQYIKEGKSSQEIAELLHRSVMTIRTHRKNIRQKLKTKIKNQGDFFDY
ncbi:response regulator [Sphingobacterium kyonggiense]